MMQLGAESVFVGSGIFMKERATPLDVELDAKGKLNNPEERAEAESRAKAIVIATTHYNDPEDAGRSQRAGHRHDEGSCRSWLSRKASSCRRAAGRTSACVPCV